MKSRQRLAYGVMDALATQASLLCDVADLVKMATVLRAVFWQLMNEKRSLFKLLVPI